jgi:hypothetical protein
MPALSESLGEPQGLCGGRQIAPRAVRACVRAYRVASASDDRTAVLLPSTKHRQAGLDFTVVMRLALE